MGSQGSPAGMAATVQVPSSQARSHAEVPLAPPGLGAVVAAVLVGVAGAELALELPEQVRELGARAHPVQQRPVAVAHADPVHLGHVGGPEVVALEAPGLVEHLAPLGHRVHGDAQAPEVDPPGAAVHPVVLLGGLVAGGDDAQLAALAVAHRRGVLGEPEVEHRAGELLHRLLLQVEGKEPAGELHVGVVAEGAGDGPHGPQGLALHGGELAEAPLGDREGDDALGDPVEVDLHRGGGVVVVGVVALALGLGAVLLVLAVLLLLVVLGLQGPRLQHEGRGHVGAQAQGVGLLALGEAEVEVEPVVDGIEGAAGEEVEPLALGVPGGVRVLEHRAGDGVDLARGQGHHPDLLGVEAGGEGVGDEAPVGAEGGAGDGAVVALVEDGELPVLAGDADELVPVVGEDHPVGHRRGLEGVDAALEGLDDPGLAGAVGDVDLQGLLAGGVAHAHEVLAVVEPARQAPARPVVGEVAAHRALPVAEGERPAPGDDGERVALGVGVEALEVHPGVDEAALALDPGGGEAHGDLAAAAGRVEDEERPAGVIDDAPSVGGRVPGVVVGMLGVAREVREALALDGHRVEVPGALGVTQEVEAPAEPHGAGEVPLELQGVEGPAAVGVEPQLAHGAPAVALPPGRVGGVAPEDHRAPRAAVGEVGARAEAELRERTAGHRHLEEEALVGKGARVVRGEADRAAVRGEPDGRRVAAGEGQPAGLAALPGHDPDLGLPLVAAGVGQKRPVRREPGAPAPAVGGGEAPGEAAVGGHGEEVVLGDEDHGVVVDRGRAVVAVGLGHGARG